MKLIVTRHHKLLTCLIGSMFVDGEEFLCNTLEDLPQEQKIPGETCIPAGTYEVIVTWSPHFNCQLPLLLSVPGFEGIRIHPGNTDADTRGCILVGIWNQKDEFISNSRLSFGNLMAKIAGQQVSIEINDAF